MDCQECTHGGCRHNAKESWKPALGALVPPCFKARPEATESPAPSGQTELVGCVVDLTKIAELGQAYAQFELIRTMATEAQTRFGKHLDLNAVERMGGIAKDANNIMKHLMAAFDGAK